MWTPIRTIGLFEGIGGFCRAAQLVGGFEWVESVELDNDAVQVLRDNFKHHIFHGDIRNYHPTPGSADLYTIGFPCTGTSQAGTRTGLNHSESNLWLESLRCICEGRPSFVVIENPEGLIYRGLRAVLGGLRMAGYQWEYPLLLSSQEIGATQSRTRIFTVAYPASLAGEKCPTGWDDSVRQNCQEIKTNSQFPIIEHGSDGFNLRFPPGLDEVPFGVEGNMQTGRLKARMLYGSTVIPQQAAIALQRVKYLHDVFAREAVA